jgi:hypothetical protein
LEGDRSAHSTAGIYTEGDVLLDEATVDILGAALTIREWRNAIEAEHGEPFAVVTHAEGDVVAHVVPESAPVLEPVALRAWVHRTVYEREVSGQSTFQTEFRPCVALFVRFLGIDYDMLEAKPKWTFHPASAEGYRPLRYAAANRPLAIKAVMPISTLAC